MSETIGQPHWPITGHALAPGVQTPGFPPMTEEILGEIVRRIVHAVNPYKIILFGSYTYGVPSQDSDLDLLVIMDTEERPGNRYRAISRALRPRPFPMDILVRTPAEVDVALSHDDPFISEILGRGNILYDRPK